MRLKRRNRPLEACTPADLLEFDQIQTRTRNVKDAIYNDIHVFRENADAIKVHVDDVTERVVEKVKSLTYKAKVDIDGLVKSEEDKFETIAMKKIAEIENRLARLRTLQNRHIRHQSQRRINSLLAETEQMRDVINTKQIEFTLNNKIKDVLYFISNLGKVRLQHRKDKHVVTSPESTLADSGSCTSLEQAMSLTSLIEEQSESLCSTSQNSSMSSLTSIDKTENISSTLSLASSSFCEITVFRPGRNGFDRRLRPAHSDHSLTLEDVAVENVWLNFTLPSNSSESLDGVSDSRRAENMRKEYVSKLNVPLYNHTTEKDNLNEATRDIEETSWNSSLTLSNESCGNKEECFIEDLNCNNCRSILGNTNAELNPIALKFETEFLACEHRTGCVISDITLMPDQKIALVDHYHNSLQIYSKEFDLIYEEKCSYPMSVCTVNSTTVAVSLRRDSQISLFRIYGNRLLCFRNITVPCSTYIWNVVYKSANLYVVCDHNHVHVLTLDGTETKVIRTGVPVHRGYIRYFDVSDDGSRLFLCEGLGYRLRCLDQDGNCVWSFGAENVPGKCKGTDSHVIEDVCFINGRLLATNWMQSKIFEISLKGEYVRDIISDNLESPRAMGVMGNRLVVTQFNPNIENCKKRTIKVFNICNT